MALSLPAMFWVSERIAEAREILANPRSTQSQRTVARMVLGQWSK